MTEREREREREREKEKKGGRKGERERKKRKESQPGETAGFPPSKSEREKCRKHRTDLPRTPVDTGADGWGP
jgi:hypothetical protein